MKFAPSNILLQVTYFEMRGSVISILQLPVDTVHSSF
jgi:hypothetical protein